MTKPKKVRRESRAAFKTRTEQAQAQFADDERARKAKASRLKARVNAHKLADDAEVEAVDSLTKRS